MTKFLATLAVFTVIATPAFAQSFCTCDGTGSVLKFANNPITYQNHAPAIVATTPARQNAFAMAHGAPIRAGQLLKLKLSDRSLR
jgi:hypothetical protein